MQLPLGAQDVDASFLLRVRLKRQARLVQPGSNIKAALPILFDAVRSAARTPIVNQLPAGGIDGAVLAQIEAPQLTCPAGIVVIVVGDVKITVVGRDQHAISPLDLVADHASDL